MSIFKTPKVESEKHRRFVASMPCMITGSTYGVQAHHLLRVGGKGMGTKTCDSWCIPLRHDHHRGLHEFGDEFGYLELFGVEYEEAKNRALELARMSPCKKIRSCVDHD